MPSLSFYALRPDLPDLLGYVSAETDCQVFEAYSVPDQELRRFGSVAEVVSAFPSDPEAATAGTAVSLMLWSPQTGGQVRVRRFDLKPGAVPGNTYRYTAEGWGLIQLYIGGTTNRGINSSRLAHNSETRARAWEATDIERLGPVDTWDWSAITILGRKLRYHVQRRIAVDKAGSRPILRSAEAKLRQGYELRE